MRCECPKCSYEFSAHIEKGHLFYSFVDPYGGRVSVHAPTCKCFNTKITARVKHGRKTK